MSVRENITIAVDAEIRLPLATAQLVRVDVNEPADYVRREPDAYRLDLSLTPRPGNARACYRDRWSPHRFEHIGKVFVLPPGETVQARSDVGSQQTSVLCYLRPEPFREWFDRDLQWTGRRLEASLDIRSANIRALLLRLADELRQPGFASEVLAGLITTELALEVGRYCTSIEEGPPRGGLTAWRLRLIDARLREIGQPPTLSELADLCRLSVRALTRGFRVSRGISIGAHVAQCRLDFAKQLLAAGESAKKTARLLGFASSSSFSYAFRRVTGETPGEFRRCHYRKMR
jgi:AraC family transcriptional regulator